jgi:hypothetical protein
MVEKKVRTKNHSPTSVSDRCANTFWSLQGAIGKMTDNYRWYELNKALNNLAKAIR